MLVPRGFNLCYHIDQLSHLESRLLRSCLLGAGTLLVFWRDGYHHPATYTTPGHLFPRDYRYYPSTLRLVLCEAMVIEVYNVVYFYLHSSRNTSRSAPTAEYLPTELADWRDQSGGEEVSSILAQHLVIVPASPMVYGLCHFDCDNDHPSR